MLHCNLLNVTDPRKIQYKTIAPQSL